MRCPDGLVLWISALAVAVADAVPDPDDLSLLAALATQFGDTLATLSLTRSRTPDAQSRALEAPSSCNA